MKYVFAMLVGGTMIATSIIGGFVAGALFIIAIEEHKPERKEPIYDSYE